MNKKLLEIFEKNGVRSIPDSTFFPSLREITTNLQFSSKDYIVFYNLSNETSEKLFHERLVDKEPGLIILNKKPAQEPTRPYLVINEKDCEVLKEDLANLFYPIREGFKVYGITGTNGKSTCVSLCEQLLVQQNKRAGSLGTMGASINGVLKDFGIVGTTPSYVDLRRIIHLIESEVDHLFMEVSSHAIMQNRLGSLQLEGAVWTSFSQDHLDYHNTMEEYFEAKLQIVDLLKKEGKLFIPSAQKELYKKIKKALDKLGKGEKVLVAGPIDKNIAEKLPVFFKVEYNKQNLEVVLSILGEIISKDGLDLEKINQPKGRFDIQEVDNKFIVIDYAHTPDAIENLLKATRKAFDKSKIFTLFGCGGDRDSAKRPLMARAAESYSDFVIVTSDNPRSEKPEDIISDTLKGLKKKALLVEPNRGLAIKEAFRFLNDGDVLIIAGKGHEEYQEINGKKIPYSDFKMVDEIKAS